MADTDTKTTSAPANTEKKKDDGVEAVLLAKFWKEAVPDTNPVQYVRHRAGDVVTVSQPIFDSLNSFRPTFRKVDE